MCVAVSDKGVCLLRFRLLGHHRAPSALRGLLARPPRDITLGHCAVKPQGPGPDSYPDRAGVQSAPLADAALCEFLLLRNEGSACLVV